MMSSRLRLREAAIDTPDLDAQLLVEWATGAQLLDLVSWPEKLIDQEQIALLNEGLERRIAGEPVHRIIGVREFFGLPFRLSPQTLEPRPDTEVLVELVSPYVEKIIEQHGRALMLDMGTGTGAIVIALLHQFEKLNGIGLDVADGALAMARINAAANGVSRQFAALKSDWFANVSGKFHLIVSNPPYIPSKDIDDLSREVREHDPLAALDGGDDGLDFYRALASEACAYLYQNGIIAVEIGAGQFNDVKAIFERADCHLINSACDLGGHRRAMVFRHSNFADIADFADFVDV
ncbi:peptide chain release factor N(5)-glutamine methyltransferase [Brucella gallinifaecis]|uniref:Release factor glutamine methyltransferase n=1 Tax=Brucella gallinifaecis TaxID=215590 RepID=A0A502BMM7_9HYPH|nr:peptide chain release factor N(5)-glutamine methyltransferase [Brucella gallinifaecis]TPF74891.1 peptide chain release factor N(5)-glutamine methyltransferase [Brucella gallinifaecis]